MQSVPAWMYEAMTIGAFGMAIAVLVLGIVVVLKGTTPLSRKYFEEFAAFPLSAIIWGGGLIILGGGLIWIGLHYGFEFHERLIALVSQPVSNPPPVAPPVPSSACNTVEARYGLIIDAGSSGSRIYIYCWKSKEANRVQWVTAALGQDGKPLFFKVPARLADVSDNVHDDDAQKAVEPLIDYAIEKIGSQTLAQTPLYLMATAGMRLLPPERREKILSKVDKYLEKEFTSFSSTVISQDDEALYGWIAVNYLMGFLKEEKYGNSLPTMGILELGGASTQIAYASSDSSQQGLATLPWGKTTYQIYGHSFGYLGQDKALDKLDAVYKANNSNRKPINPCYPKDYRPGDYQIGEGTGNYDECKDEIKRTLFPLLNDQQMNNQRRLPHGVFLAYAGYYYTYSFLSKIFNKPILSLAELEIAGHEYCSEDWEKLDNWKELKSYSDETLLPEYCFKAAYIAALLQTGYGFSNETQQIFIADTIQGNDISWTLGAMVYQAGAKLP